MANMMVYEENHRARQRNIEPIPQDKVEKLIGSGFSPLHSVSPKKEVASKPYYNLSEASQECINLNVIATNPNQKRSINFTNFKMG